MVLFGERHSGTNLVEYVLSRSCSTAFYPPEAYGFKHWWLNERENSSRVSLIATQLLVPVIFIVREPIAWMMAMAKRPHHNPRPNSMSISHFILRPWHSYESPSPFRWPPTGAIVESAPSLYGLRAIKLNQMIHLQAQLKRSVLLRYEDLHSLNAQNVSERLGRVLLYHA